MIYLIAVSLIWSFSFGLIKTNMSSLDPALVAFLRLVLSAAVFLPFLRLKKTAPQVSLKVFLIGALQFGLMYIAYIYSFQYLKAYQIAAMTIFTPLYVEIINDFINRRFAPRPYLFVIMAVFASALVTWESLSVFEAQKGFFLVQLSNICFAGGQVLYRKLLKSTEVKDREIFAAAYGGAAAITFTAVLLRGSLPQVAQISVSQWAALLYLGVIASGLCFFLWNKGVRIANITNAAISNNLKMPLAVAVSLFFFGEYKTESAESIVRLGLGTALLAASLILNSRQKPAD
ncbi:DMT family transporter [Sedimentisphaera cyanobacteriorum]|nr:EamA family transporter [Sedimentisphaera cyanobacteriorum]